MGRVFWKVAAAILLGLPGAYPAHAKDFDYTLQEGSTFQEGCMGPLCFCPALAGSVLEGEMFLVPVGEQVVEETRYIIFQIFDAVWSYTDHDGLEHVARSVEGEFRSATEGKDQVRLTMDLEIDGNPAQTFDSGYVPREGARPDPLDELAPEVRATMLLDLDSPCFNTAFRVIARSEATVAIETSTWGAVKRLYR